MSVSIITQNFDGGLGDARFVCATLDSSVQPSDLTYIHGGYNLGILPYMRYLAVEHGLSTFTVQYPTRPRDERYYFVSENGEWREVPRKNVRRERQLTSDFVLPESQLIMASDIDHVMSVYGIECVDAIGHSAGALRVLALAWMFPGRIRNSVLVHPAGIFKNQPRNLPRQGVKSVRGKISSLRNPVARRTVSSYLSGLGHRCDDDFTVAVDMMAEGENVLFAHMGMPDGLWANGHTAILAGDCDALFPPERILEQLDPRTAWLGVHPGPHGLNDSRDVVDEVVGHLVELGRHQGEQSFRLLLADGLASARKQELGKLANQVTGP